MRSNRRFLREWTGIYSNDHAPIHVHVRRGGGEAVFVVEPEVELRESVRLNVRELSRAEDLIDDHLELIKQNGPSTLADRALKAWHERGMIFVRFASGHEVSFPTKGNPRLESAAEEDVGRIEISPFGLHWPTLDEDLSFAGILEGRYGQR
jgi:hypothetical protein